VCNWTVVLTNLNGTRRPTREHGCRKAVVGESAYQLQGASCRAILRHDAVVAGFIAVNSPPREFQYGTFALNLGQIA